jgi:hypothetical protein
MYITNFIGDVHFFGNVYRNPQSINRSILSTLQLGGEYPWAIETPIKTTKITIKQ